MKAAWTNAPMNLPQKRKDPALGTLVVMISVIALMFGIRAFCRPKGELEDIAAMLEIETSTAEPETKNDPPPQSLPLRGRGDRVSGG